MVTVMECLGGGGLKGGEREPYSEERVSQHTMLMLKNARGVWNEGRETTFGVSRVETADFIHFQR